MAKKTACVFTVAEGLTTIFQDGLLFQLFIIHCCCYCVVRILQRQEKPTMTAMESQRFVLYWRTFCLFSYIRVLN
jgi:hypothetical protein